MRSAPSIQLPTMSANQHDYRSLIENFVLDELLSVAGNNIKTKKYFKTANEQIYEDMTNLLQSGVPAWLIRTTREETEAANPNEGMDNLTCSIEVINGAPVGIEKGIENVDRYVYTMNGLAREHLRSNRIDVLPNNNKRPFIYAGNRDIFRDDDVDILLTEFKVNYVAV